MPFIVNTPDTVPVKVESVTDKTIDSYYIKTITISLAPGNSAAIVFNVVWSKGYTDQGKFTAIESTTSMLSGSSLLTKMSEQVVNGLSHYDDFKKAIWELLQSEGIVPPGVIS
jgi:hypothetical protein